MTRAERLMMAAELIDDAPELGAALEEGCACCESPEDFEALLSRGLVLPDGDLTPEGTIVLQLLIASRGDPVTP